jgi:PAS domain S-box-containing protein
MGQAVKAAAARNPAQLLRDVADLASSPVYVLDLEGRYLFANRRWEALLGVQRGECVGRSREDLFPVGDRAIAERRKNDLEVVRRGRPVTFEESNEEEDGTHTYLSVKYPLRDEVGRVYAIAGISTDITERKRLEQALSESRGLLQSTLDAIPAAVLHIDPDGTILAANRAALVGRNDLTATDLVGRKLRDVLAPALVERRLGLLDQVVRSDSCVRFEDRVGDRSYESFMGPVGAGNAIRDCVVMVSRDVSARERTRAAIEQSRDDLARAETMALLGSYRLERGADEYICSDGIFRIIGRPRESFTVTASSILGLLQPDDLPIIDRYRHALSASEEPAPVTLRLFRGDGRMIHVQAWSKPLFDAGGAVVGWFGTLQDVTARVQAEAALKEQAGLERLRRSIAQAPVALAMFDRDMRYLSYSQRWLVEHGVPCRDLIGMSAYDVVAGIPERWREADRRALAGEVVRSDEDRWERPDGSVRWMRWENRPWRDAQGEVGGVVIYAEDITARKEAEARAQRMEEQLRQAQKMEAVGQLTCGIAHDFNNLLAVIIGGLELISEEAARGLPAEQELIEAAIRSGRRGQELVHRLLAFSRQMPLRPEPTSVDQLVLDTLRLLQRTLGAAIEIDVSLNVGPAMVLVDRGRFASALVNLALNARDAMPEGGRLRIETARRPAAPAGDTDAGQRSVAEHISIVVSDTGRGMTEEIRRRAFDPFFTTKPEGTGLGLGMVHGFVEQSGGHIEIASAAGGGTEVTIRLPLSPAIESGAEDAGVLPAATDKRKVVLLVEDDDDVRAVTAAHLKRLGYLVRGAASGDEAIAAIESPQTIDVMLTDIMLRGGIDGIALLKEVLRVRPNMGVLCMSGLVPTEKSMRWLRAQNIRLLEKPFARAQLADALRELEL